MLNKRVIFTIFIAVLISGLLGFVYSSVSSSELKKQLFTYKVHSEKKYQLLVVGDSRIYRGVSSKIFEDSLGLTSFNLGFSSALYEKKLYKLIDEKLDWKSNTKIIILGITPHSLLDYKNYQNGHIARLRKMKKEEVIDYLYLFPLKHFFSPTSTVKLWDYITKGESKETNYMEEYYYQQGWVASDYIQRKPYSALDSYFKTFTNMQIDSLKTADLFRKIDEWTNKGVKVYGFIPPSSINIEALERKRSGFRDKEFIEQFLKTKAKWIVLDSVYKSYDGSHLIKDDALALSREIAAKIKINKTDSVFCKKKRYRAEYYAHSKSTIRFTDDMENRERFTIESVNAYSGKRVGYLSSDDKYFNFAFINSKTIIEKGVKRIVSSAFVYFPLDAEIGLYYNIRRNGKQLHSSIISSKFSLDPNKWQYLSIDFNIAKDFQENDVITIGIVNNNKEEIFIDDIKIDFY